jgi:hypothetical protein
MNLLVSLTVLIFAFIALLSKGKTLKTAPLISIVQITLMILYFLGGFIWNRIRQEAGPGYLGFIYVDDLMLNNFKAAIGPIILAIALPFFILVVVTRGREQNPNLPVQETFVSDRLLNLVICVPFLICILGEGTSILFRESYLSANGIPVFLRLSGITNLVGIAFLGLVFIYRNCKLFSWEFSLLLSWFLVLLAKGSRSALLPFIIILAILLQTHFSRLLKFVIILLSAVFLTLITGIIYASRGHTHGIFMLPANLFLQLDSPIDSGTSLLRSVSILSAALFTTIVTVPLSIGTLDLNGILANANPLISNISSFSYDTTSSGVERIFPYTWVPASSAGTLFGVVGGLGIFLIFLLMSSANMFCITRSSWKLSGVFFKLAEISFFAQFFFFLEYSTRIWFRVFWAFWLCFGIGLLILLAEKSIERSIFHGKSSVAPNV